MAEDQDFIRDMEDPEGEPVITVMTARNGRVNSRIVGGDKPVPSTYPSSSHPDGAIPYA